MFQSGKVWPAFSLSFLIALNASCVRQAGTPAAGETEAELARSLANSVLDVMPDLRNAVSLRSWRTAHSSDAVQPYAPRLAEVESWCVRARSETSLGAGRTSVRTVYFYVPDMPPSHALPEGIPEAELINDCRLGFVWSEIEDTDASRVA